MDPKVRFAPSPTGHLHVGNARIALINWLFAQAHNGRFALRLDDTDAERSLPEYAAAIEEDLAWLGLSWDEFARQSDRLSLYQAAVETLKRAGRLYACYETPEELAIARKLLRARGRPPIYDRAALALSDGERRALEAEGRRPHWRLRLEGRTVNWDDLVRGGVAFDAASLSDPVLLREDGRPLYTLTSVVDDLDMSITHVLRGEDHVANTAVQIQLIEALGGTPPAFGHLALLVDAKGEGLSKRIGSMSLRSLRDDGIEPMAVNALLARLGTSAAVRPAQSLDELVAEFDLGRFSRAPARFDLEELRRLNTALVHAMSFEDAAKRLVAQGIEGLTPEIWQAIRANLARVAEAEDWLTVIHGPIEPQRLDPELTTAAAELLPPPPWEEGVWKSWTGAVREATGKSGKALFLPLRAALTGRDHGPEMRNLLPLIGPERARARLLGQRA